MLQMSGGQEAAKLLIHHRHQTDEAHGDEDAGGQTVARTKNSFGASLSIDRMQSFEMHRMTIGIRQTSTKVSYRQIIRKERAQVHGDRHEELSRQIVFRRLHYAAARKGLLVINQSTFPKLNSSSFYRPEIPNRDVTLRGIWQHFVREHPRFAVQKESVFFRNVRPWSKSRDECD